MIEHLVPGCTCQGQICKKCKQTLCTYAFERLSYNSYGYKIKYKVKKCKGCLGEVPLSAKKASIRKVEQEHEEWSALTEALQVRGLPTGKAAIIAVRPVIHNICTSSYDTQIHYIGDRRRTVDRKPQYNG